MLVAWIALTCGIALGSWWAYYELGWGGFWFWDPVENASLMPWLMATALLHSALATEGRGAFRTWTLLLAIAGFSLSLIGTFLVRSGVLSSVHAFANDPDARLLHLVLFALRSAARWRCSPGARRTLRAARIRTASRETALLLNNVFLFAACACVFVGTLYPLVLDASTGAKISVGPPYFALTFAPIFFALSAAGAVGAAAGLAAGDLGGMALALAPALGLAARRGAVACWRLVSPRSLPAPALSPRRLADRRQHARSAAKRKGARAIGLRRGARPCRAWHFADGRRRHDPVAQRGAGRCWRPDKPCRSGPIPCASTA